MALDRLEKAETEPEIGLDESVGQTQYECGAEIDEGLDKGRKVRLGL